MKVAVGGKGGRESALVKKLAENGEVECVDGLPGNPQIEKYGSCFPIDLMDPAAVVSHCRRMRYDLVVIGPEDPLIAGVVDALEAEGIRTFGPTAAAAQLEGSKAFAKDAMREFGVPTAAYEVFSDPGEAEKFARRFGGKVAVKAVGSALGKGVEVCDQASDVPLAMERLRHSVGSAAAEFVIEERLYGQECSILAMCDGKHAVMFPPIQDYKRLLMGDKGPMTGGMGCKYPINFGPRLDEATVTQYVRERILEPTLRGMQSRGTPFKGCLFLGLMITEAGIYVLEYNVRFGDPETELAMVMHDEDLLELVSRALEGNLENRMVRWKPGAAVCLVAASGGYPDKYQTGYPITIENHDEPGEIFFAGIASRDGQLVTAGGRVAAVVARAPHVIQARIFASRLMRKIDFPEKYFRPDIGL